MIKSAFLDPEFCRFWEERSGDNGQAYKSYVTEPVIFELLGDLKDKDILELGPGNGAFARKILSYGVKTLTLLDVSQYNLDYAKSRCNDPRISFLCQDAKAEWPIRDKSLDCIASDMMLNEIDPIEKPMEEAYRTLGPGGLFVFSVFHPAFDLYVYAQEKAGVAQKKIRGIEGYFTRKFTMYDMGAESKTSPALAKTYSLDLSVPHFHRPIADYCTALRKAGFMIKEIHEPEINKQLLAAQPAFRDYLDRPVSLVFAAEKP